MLQAPPLSGRNLLLLKALIIGIRTQTLWPGFRDVTDHSIKNFENVFLLKPFFHLLKINGSFLSFRKKHLQLVCFLLSVSVGFLLQPWHPVATFVPFISSKKSAQEAFYILPDSSFFFLHQGESRADAHVLYSSLPT